MALYITKAGECKRVSPANGKNFTIAEVQQYVGGLFMAYTIAGGLRELFVSKGQNGEKNETATNLLRELGSALNGDVDVHGNALLVRIDDLIRK